MNKNFNQVLDQKHSIGDKRLAHIEHIDIKENIHVNKKDEVHKGNGNKKDTMDENIGENIRSRRWGPSLPGLRMRDPPLGQPSACTEICSEYMSGGRGRFVRKFF